MAYTVRKIEIDFRKYPIFRNEFDNWMTLLATVSKKDKKLIVTFCRTALSLAKGRYLPDSYYTIDIKVNGEVLTAKNVLTFDLSSATKNIKAKNFKRESEWGEGSYTFNYLDLKEEIESNEKKEPDIEGFIAFVKSYVDKIEDNETLYYHSLAITEDILFKLQSDETGEVYKKIRRELLPFLRFFDLSNISFQDVDIREEDLSYTNIKGLDISKTYKKSARGANLKGVVSDDKVISGCDMSDCILEECYAYIDVTTTKTEGMIYDAHVVFLDSEGHVLKNSVPKRKDNSIILHF